MLFRSVAKFHRFFNTHRATDDLRQALLASYRGRIETLFVPVNRNAWGAIDPEGHVTAIHEERRLGDDDLLDVAAVQTLLHGGRVYAVPYEEMPSAQPLAAVMRY